MRDFFDVSSKYLLNDIYSYLERKPNLKKFIITKML